MIREGKTLAWQTLVSLYTGEDPIVTRYPDYTEIQFTPSQVAQFQELLKKAHEGEPTDVRISVKPIFLPFYLKKFSPWILGLVLGGAALGFLLRR